MDTIDLMYRFILPDGSTEEFSIQLNAQSLDLIPCTDAELPPWTDLSFHQCPHCTLLNESVSSCPMAACLSSIVERFKALLSYDRVHLEVISQERVISLETTVQRAIASYMGLIMATCGCPNTLFLQPMARFHLPLASEAETIYRAFSMYALAQHFIELEGGEVDRDFSGLEKKYKGLQILNESMLIRLKAATDTDSSINALLNLDVYARAMPYVVEDKLEELQFLFSSYLESKPPQNTS